jgi:hypothetical protein
MKLIAPLSLVLFVHMGVVLAADRPPVLDVNPSCKAVAKMGGLGTTESCLSSEQRSRDQLDKEWPQFTIADKSQCKEIPTGFEPTYSELLTCLEMARDSRTHATQPTAADQKPRRQK